MRTFQAGKFNLWRRFISVFVAASFLWGSILPPQALAQGVLFPFNLPAPGTIVPLSAAYNPVILKGMTIHPDNPFQFDFIIDTGDENVQGETLKQESTKLIKYFMASLTVPEKEMWVNLSPAEKDRVIPQSFGETEMGRDLLAQDYILKQLSSSLMHPDEETGAEFWKEIYATIQKKYGATDIPVETLNKIWIVPDQAKVFAHEGNVFVVSSHLKVMLEDEYEALPQQKGNADSLIPGKNNSGTHDDFKRPETTKLIQEIIIPAIEREVNEGKNFANLRQIVNSMILATWYKRNLKESILTKIYADQSKTAGVDVKDKAVTQKIYDQYMEAFKKGVYDLIHEDYDSTAQQVIPRKYFSGGVDAAQLASAIEETDAGSGIKFFGQAQQVLGEMMNVDQAMLGDRIAELAQALAMRDPELEKILIEGLDIAGMLRRIGDMIKREPDVVLRKMVELELFDVESTGFDRRNFMLKNFPIAADILALLSALPDITNSEVFMEKTGEERFQLIAAAVDNSVDFNKLIDDLVRKSGLPKAMVQRKVSQWRNRPDEAMMGRFDDLPVGELTLKTGVISDLPAIQAQRYGSETFIMSPGANGGYRNISFVDFNRSILSRKMQLFGTGVRQGDKVAFLAPNSPEFIEAAMGVWSLGGVVVPMNQTAPMEHLRHMLENSAAKILIVHPDLEATAQELLAQFPQLKIFTFAELSKQASFAPSFVNISPDDPALILYTSGTTKLPKGVLLSHKNIMYNAEATARTWAGQLTQEDTTLGWLPFFHVMGLTFEFLGDLYSGTTYAFPRLKPGPPTPDQLYSALKESGASILYTVPKMLDGLALMSRKNPDVLAALRNLKFIMSGGAALSASTGNYFQQNGVNVIQGYGMTEATGAILLGDPQKRDWRLLQKMPGVDVLFEEESGVQGKLLVVDQAPSVMQGYFRNEEATNAVLSGGRFNTGDLFIETPEGFIYQDRYDDVEKRPNGEKFSPAVVQAALEKSPLINKVIISSKWVDALIAVVEPNNEVLENQGITSASDIEKAIWEAFDGVNQSQVKNSRVRRENIVILAKGEEPLPVSRKGEILRKAAISRFEGQIRQKYSDKAMMAAVGKFQFGSLADVPGDKRIKFLNKVYRERQRQAGRVRSLASTMSFEKFREDVFRVGQINKNDEFIIGSINGEPAGTVSIYGSLLGTVQVLSEFKNQGLGYQMVVEGLKRMRDKGFGIDQFHADIEDTDEAESFWWEIIERLNREPFINEVKIKRESGHYVVVGSLKPDEAMLAAKKKEESPELTAQERKTIESILSLSQSGLGFQMQGGNLSRENEAFFEAVETVLDGAPEAERVAQTLARMEAGSLRVLQAVELLTEKEADIIAQKDSKALRELSKEEKIQFKKRFQNLVEDYKTNLPKVAYSSMLRRLIPLSTVGLWSKYFEIPPSLVVSAFRTHSDFPSWFPQAYKKALEIENAVNGRSYAWRIIINHQLDTIDKWVVQYNDRITALAPRVGGKENARRLLITHGLKKIDEQWLDQFETKALETDEIVGSLSLALDIVVAVGVDKVDGWISDNKKSADQIMENEKVSKSRAWNRIFYNGPFANRDMESDDAMLGDRAALLEELEINFLSPGDLEDVVRVGESQFLFVVVTPEAFHRIYVRGERTEGMAHDGTQWRIVRSQVYESDDMVGIIDDETAVVLNEENLGKYFIGDPKVLINEFNAKMGGEPKRDDPVKVLTGKDPQGNMHFVSVVTKLIQGGINVRAVHPEDIDELSFIFPNWERTKAPIPAPVDKAMLGKDGQQTERGIENPKDLKKYLTGLGLTAGQKVVSIGPGSPFLGDLEWEKVLVSLGLDVWVYEPNKRVKSEWNEFAQQLSQEPGTLNVVKSENAFFENSQGHEDSTNVVVAMSVFSAPYVWLLPDGARISESTKRKLAEKISRSLTLDGYFIYGWYKDPSKVQREKEKEKERADAGLELILDAFSKRGRILVNVKESQDRYGIHDWVIYQVKKDQAVLGKVQDAAKAIWKNYGLKNQMDLLALIKAVLDSQEGDIPTFSEQEEVLWNEFSRKVEFGFGIPELRQIPGLRDWVTGELRKYGYLGTDEAMLVNLDGKTYQAHVTPRPLSMMKQNYENAQIPVVREENAPKLQIKLNQSLFLNVVFNRREAKIKDVSLHTEEGAAPKDIDLYSVLVDEAADENSRISPYDYFLEVLYSKRTNKITVIVNDKYEQRYKEAFSSKLPERLRGLVEVIGEEEALKRMADENDWPEFKDLEYGLELPQTHDQAMIVDNPVRVAINGAAGAIGSKLILASIESPYDFEIAALNDLSFNLKTQGLEGEGLRNFREALAKVFNTSKMTQLHDAPIRFEKDEAGRFWLILPVGVSSDKQQRIRLTDELESQNFPWAQENVHLVYDATGAFLNRAQQHIDAGAKEVIITAPALEGDIKHYVAGVNTQVHNPDIDICSGASCTIGSIAPPLKVLDEAFGIESYIVNTELGYTKTILANAKKKGLQTGEHIVTAPYDSAATALGLILPQLAGKGTVSINGVPTVSGSLSNISIVFKRDVTADEINAVLKAAAEGPLKGIMVYYPVQPEGKPSGDLSSADIVGRPESAIIQANATKVVSGRHAIIKSWYDNEFGFSTRTVDLGAMRSLARLKSSVTGRYNREAPTAIKEYLESNKGDQAMLNVDSLNRRDILVIKATGEKGKLFGRPLIRLGNTNKLEEHLAININGKIIYIPIVEAGQKLVTLAVAQKMPMLVSLMQKQEAKKLLDLLDEPVSIREFVQLLQKEGILNYSVNLVYRDASNKNSPIYHHPKLKVNYYHSVSLKELEKRRETGKEILDSRKQPIDVLAFVELMQNAGYPDYTKFLAYADYDASGSAMYGHSMLARKNHPQRAVREEFQRRGEVGKQILDRQNNKISVKQFQQLMKEAGFENYTKGHVYWDFSTPSTEIYHHPNLYVERYYATTRVGLKKRRELGKQILDAQVTPIDVRKFVSLMHQAGYWRYSRQNAHDDYRLANSPMQGHVNLIVKRIQATLEDNVMPVKEYGLELPPDTAMLGKEFTEDWGPQEMENAARKLRAVFEKAWGDDTAHPAYVKPDKDRPCAAGQCWVTSLVLNKVYGWDFYFNEEEGIYHSFVKHNGYWIDLTADQFDNAFEGKFSEPIRDGKFIWHETDAAPIHTNAKKVDLNAYYSDSNRQEREERPESATNRFNRLWKRFVQKALENPELLEGVIPVDALRGLEDSPPSLVDGAMTARGPLKGDIPISKELSLPDWAKDFIQAHATKAYNTQEERMAVAIELSRLNVEHETGGPFGAAVFDLETGRLVSVGVNRVVSMKASLAHAEIMALTLAQERLESFTLDQEGKGLELVSSAQPCAQCFGAIPWSGVKSVSMGSRGADVEGIVGFDEGPLHPDWVNELEKRGIAVARDILREEANQVLRAYVAKEGVVYNAKGDAKNKGSDGAMLGRVKLPVAEYVPGYRAFVLKYLAQGEEGRAKIVDTIFGNRELLLIENGEIRKFAREALIAAPSYFWKIPASLTGQYHPEDTYVYGGEILHIQRVVKAVQQTMERERITDHREKDVLLAAALIHDITKYSMHKELPMSSYQRSINLYKHGRLVRELLENQDNRAHFASYSQQDWYNEILEIVRTSYGDFAPAEEDRPQTHLQEILADAKYFASRPENIIQVAPPLVEPVEEDEYDLDSFYRKRHLVKLDLGRSVRLANLIQLIPLASDSYEGDRSYLEFLGKVYEYDILKEQGLLTEADPLATLQKSFAEVQSKVRRIPEKLTQEVNVQLQSWEGVSELAQRFVPVMTNAVLSSSFVNFLYDEIEGRIVMHIDSRHATSRYGHQLGKLLASGFSLKLALQELQKKLQQELPYGVPIEIMDEPFGFRKQIYDLISAGELGDLTDPHVHHAAAVDKEFSWEFVIGTSSDTQNFFSSTRLALEPEKAPAGENIPEFNWDYFNVDRKYVNMIPLVKQVRQMRKDLTGRLGLQYNTDDSVILDALDVSDKATEKLIEEYFSLKQTFYNHLLGHVYVNGFDSIRFEDYIDYDYLNYYALMFRKLTDGNTIQGADYAKIMGVYTKEILRDKQRAGENYVEFRVSAAETKEAMAVMLEEMIRVVQEEQIRNPKLRVNFSFGIKRGGFTDAARQKMQVIMDTLKEHPQFLKYAHSWDTFSPEEGNSPKRFEPIIQEQLNQNILLDTTYHTNESFDEYKGRGHDITTAIRYADDLINLIDPLLQRGRRAAFGHSLAVTSSLLRDRVPVYLRKDKERINLFELKGTLEWLQGLPSRSQELAAKLDVPRAAQKIRNILSRYENAEGDPLIVLEEPLITLDEREAIAKYVIQEIIKRDIFVEYPSFKTDIIVEMLLYIDQLPANDPLKKFLDQIVIMTDVGGQVGVPLMKDMIAEIGSELRRGGALQKYRMPEDRIIWYLKKLTENGRRRAAAFTKGQDKAMLGMEGQVNLVSMFFRDKASVLAGMGYRSADRPFVRGAAVVVPFAEKLSLQAIYDSNGFVLRELRLGPFDIKDYFTQGRYAAGQKDVEALTPAPEGIIDFALSRDPQTNKIALSIIVEDGAAESFKEYLRAKKGLPLDVEIIGRQDAQKRLLDEEQGDFTGQLSFEVNYSKDKAMLGANQKEGSLGTAIDDIEGALARKSDGKTFLIFVAGGSASGKTSQVSQKLAERFNAKILSMDDYYRGVTFMRERGIDNFDVPDVFDWDLLKQQLGQIKNGETISKPKYSFQTGQREGYENFTPTKVVVVEGLYPLDDRIAELGDYRIFVKVGRLGQLLRRLNRDVVSGRTGQSFHQALGQYFKQVVPAQARYIDATQNNAQLVIDNDYKANEEASQLSGSEIQAKVKVDNFETLKLEEIVAVKIGYTEQEDTYYEPKDRSLAQSGESLRIRKEGGALTATYKGPLIAADLRRRLKIDFPFDQDWVPLLEDDYNPKFHLAKKRTIYRKGNLLINLDEVDGLGKFIEITAQSVNDTQEAKAFLQRLGFQENDILSETYEQLITLGDKATAAEPPGGIDLNPENIKFEQQGSSVPFNLPPQATPAELENLLHIRGFVPVIHQIIPVHNLPLLLGEKEFPSPQLSLK